MKSKNGHLEKENEKLKEENAKEKTNSEVLTNEINDLKKRNKEQDDFKQTIKKLSNELTTIITSDDAKSAKTNNT